MSKQILKRIEELAEQLATTNCVGCKKVIAKKIEDYKERLALRQFLNKWSKSA